MKRSDLLSIIKGKGEYLDDLPFSGYHAVFVRSPYAHAKIRGIDVSDVTRKGGLVLTGREVFNAINTSSDEEGSSASTPPIALDKVRFYGEPVALVLGRDPYEAQDLAELVNVDYEPLEPVMTIDRALKDDILVFEEKGSNEVYRRTTEYGKMPSDRRIELELYWSRSSGNPIETFASFVIPGDPLVIYTNMQAAAYQSSFLSPLGRVKLNPVRQGGSFGSKFSLLKYVIALGVASKKFNVPVKWVETRTEHLAASNSSGPERKFKIEASFKDDGTITGLKFRVWEDVGASLFNGQAFKPQGILAGPYKVKNIVYDASLIATNKNPAGAFRGAGTPPHTWAIERVIDAIADELGMNRAEVRRNNLVDQFPYEAPYAVYDSGNPKKLLEMALSRNDLWSMRKKGYGVGIACSTDPSTPNGSEEVSIRTGEGKVILSVGYGPEGQGNEHVAKELLSSMLKVPMEKIDVEVDGTLHSFGPGGSRMAVFMAGAIKGSVEELIAKAERKTGGKFVEGKIRTSEGIIDITDVNVESKYTFSLQGKYRFNAYPFACDIAVVKEVEGKITPVRFVVYLDPGTPLDEDVVKEQVIGGTAIGISVALYERYIYSPEGQLLTSNLNDYGLPAAPDLPPIEVNLISSPSPFTPLGAKGIGEIPVGVAAAAITSAIEDLTKKRITTIPFEK